MNKNVVMKLQVTMRQLHTNLVAACVLLVLCFVSHGHGAAVMSIDLGSEWIKVIEFSIDALWL